jgi:hypothetical protein
MRSGLAVRRAKPLLTTNIEDAMNEADIDLVLKSPRINDFWKHVEVLGPEDCWNWTGAKHNRRQGYGRISISNVLVRSHSLSYLIAHGSLPCGSVVRHTCDNASCVNPAHLLLGTVQDNNMDRIVRGRSLGPKGEANAKARITSDQVIEIRQRYAKGELQSALAVEFGIAEPTVWCIVKRRSWKHVT